MLMLFVLAWLLLGRAMTFIAVERATSRAPPIADARIVLVETAQAYRACKLLKTEKCELSG